MEVIEPSGQRFEVALELFRSGQPISYRGVSFYLAPGGHLAASIPTSWYLENTTEQTALNDLGVAENALKDLIAESPAFASVVGNLPRQYILLHDYGAGGVELCRLVGGKLIWAKGFPAAKGAT
jgi:hypothetical protein